MREEARGEKEKKKQKLREANYQLSQKIVDILYHNSEIGKGEERGRRGEREEGEEESGRRGYVYYS